MKRIQFLILILLVSVFLYSQDNSRITAFFNDTLVNGCCKNIVF